MSSGINSSGVILLTYEADMRVFIIFARVFISVLIIACEIQKEGSD